MKIGNTSDYIAFNSYGGFSKNKDEYHILNTNTPLPWCNVMANKKFRYYNFKLWYRVYLLY